MKAHATLILTYLFLSCLILNDTWKVNNMLLVIGKDG